MEMFKLLNQYEMIYALLNVTTVKWYQTLAQCVVNILMVYM